MTNKPHPRRVWILGDPIDSGGFGKVFSVRPEDGYEAVGKLVPKAPGPERELLFAELDGVRNVVPVIDGGETERRPVGLPEPKPSAPRSSDTFLG